MSHGLNETQRYSLVPVEGAQRCLNTGKTTKSCIWHKKATVDSGLGRLGGKRPESQVPAVGATQETDWPLSHPNQKGLV